MTLLAPAPLIRRASVADVRRIKALVDSDAGQGLLEKELVTLYEDVQESSVAELGGKVVGCGALHVIWEDLAEIRTVAVDPYAAAASDRARRRAHRPGRELGLRRLFVLTFESSSWPDTASPRSREHR